MEIIKNDLTKEELQHTVEILLDLSNGELAKLPMPTLIKMSNNLLSNGMAFNNLEDKYRELLQKGNYTPLAKQYKRRTPKRPKNQAMEHAFKKGK